MYKWYEASGKEQDVIVSSRIRLRRNIQGYPFPGKMEPEEITELNKQLLHTAEQTCRGMEMETTSCMVSELREVTRYAMLERNILSKAALQEKSASSLVVSKDEAVSMLFQCDDHIRIQVSGRGLQLREALEQANKIDDLFNETYSYAFDEKYGYMTCFPTNVGTGMRAYLVLHLPLLASGSKFQRMTTELGRYGVAIRDALTTADKNPSGLYVIYNQKTLGQTEEEIIQLLTKIGMQLSGSERKLRLLRAEKHPLLVEDEAYRAYGLLKYARVLKYEEALLNLSRLRIALTAERINLEKPVSIYQMMIAVSPNNLQVYYGKTGTPEEVNRMRANYCREKLPSMIE